MSIESAVFMVISGKQYRYKNNKRGEKDGRGYKR